ncbi:MAG TPA: hypothetical protein VK753_03365 [Xanthomonadaceae bacterium]|jgi:hypothetical protein|nr:hypothetical protein [Xanthomonadaceae bacterium]
MTDPNDIAFDFAEGIAVFRLVGAHTLQAATRRIRDAIAAAHAQRIRKLAVVLVDATGFEVPGLAMRAAMIREWADAAGGVVGVAVACRPEFIDPQRFGVAFATNLGMVANVFETEAEAIEWLHDSV